MEHERDDYDDREEFENIADNPALAEYVQSVLSNEETLVLQGSLQIETAYRAVTRHALGSAAFMMLQLAKNLQDADMERPDSQNRPPIAFAMTDSNSGAPIKSELLAALRKSLEEDDLDDFERITTEELLAQQIADTITDEEDE